MAGEAITHKTDNKIQQQQERREALKVHRFTLDPNNGLKIDMGEGKVVEDKRPIQGTQPDGRNAVEKLSDFMKAAAHRASDPEGWKAWMQGEITKISAIPEGLNEAKNETKQAVTAGFKALTDGNVAEFLAQPGAINRPAFQLVSNAFDAMGKDPNAVNHALERLGKAVLKASEEYSHLPDHEKGKIIGKTMFAMINPEGDLKDAQAALKVADKVATVVDQVVWDSAKQAMKAADASPEIAQQVKQMLLDYLTQKGLSGPEFATAGVPPGYFNGMKPTETAESNILKMVGRPSEYEPLHSGHFLDLKANKILKQTDLEKLGGIAKIEKMTDAELKAIGIERYKLPQMQISAEGTAISAKCDGWLQARMDATIPAKGTVDLSLIMKGSLPEGTGGHFLAEALKAHGELPTDFLVLKNIANPETIEAFNNRVPAADTKLGRCVANALKELGLKPQSIEYKRNPWLGTVNIVIKMEK